MDRTFNSWLCICVVSIFLTTVFVIYDGIPIIHKSYSQQRNTTVSSVENATQIPDANTVNKPYLSITMQTIKDPGGYSSIGESYTPTGESVTVLVNEKDNHTCYPGAHCKSCSRTKRENKSLLRWL